MLPGTDPESADVAYQDMRWNTPLSEDHADALIGGLGVEPGDLVADLGCGWGRLLLRALAAAPGSRGIGVDSSDWAVARARVLAVEKGLSDRAEFLEGDASSWTGPADRVVCIGASHAWGGSRPALEGLRRVARPGGRVLFGDGCWTRPPSPTAAELFGDEVLALQALAEQAIRTGWRILHLSTADQREWDEFEATWRSGRERWLLAHPDDPRAPDLRAELDARLLEYLGVYRDVLGFAYLILAL